MEAEREVAMQYLLLIYEGEKRFANLSKPDLTAELGEYRAFGKEFFDWSGYAGDLGVVRHVIAGPGLECSRS